MNSAVLFTKTIHEALDQVVQIWLVPVWLTIEFFALLLGVTYRKRHDKGYFKSLWAFLNAYTSQEHSQRCLVPCVSLKWLAELGSLRSSDRTHSDNVKFEFLHTNALTDCQNKCFTNLKKINKLSHIGFFDSTIFFKSLRVTTPSLPDWVCFFCIFAELALNYYGKNEKANRGCLAPD